MVVDILGQFAVHMGVLITSMDMTRPHLVEAWVCCADSTNSTLAKDEGYSSESCVCARAREGALL
jgi:hypothetical protein